MAPTSNPATAKKKNSVSETGHAKNVANFEDLIATVTGYDTDYNPSKSGLKLAALGELHGNALAGLAQVREMNTAFNNAVNDRAAAFGGLKVLSTRLINALAATDASSKKIADARAFNNKLRGKRAGGKAPSNPDAPAPKAISVSQTSYDQQIEHFAGLLSVLKSETSYAPNESDLQITAIDKVIKDLKLKNTAVSKTHANIGKSRISRDKVLYKETTGLVDVAADVKNYVKSVYGASSPEYRDLKKISFRTI